MKSKEIQIIDATLVKFDEIFSVYDDFESMPEYLDKLADALINAYVECREHD